jgi:hypothetical protein
MEFKSRKEIINRPTFIYEKNLYDVFMSGNNQIYITKQIYLLHRSNHGILDYLYFKGIIPYKMQNWISKIRIPNDNHSVDLLYYLNKNFIQTHYNLYEYKSEAKSEAKNTMPTFDTNVYRSEANIGYCDEDESISGTNIHAHIRPKKYSELLASDYGLIDVWEKQTVEISPESAARYGVKVPVYQRSMQIRNYDRSNEGYSSTSDRASLNTFVSGYGDAFRSIQNRSDELYKKYNST